MSLNQNFTVKNNINTLGSFLSGGTDLVTIFSPYSLNTYVQSNSASWGSGGTGATIFSQQSAHNLSVYSNVNQLSGGWQSVYNTWGSTTNNSSNWNSVYNTWGSTANNSSNWDSVYSDVNGLSSHWNTAYQSVSTVPYIYSGSNGIQTKIGGNTASGNYSVVAGGNNNNASGYSSNVAGGGYNNAYGNNSNVAGGLNNTASNYYAVVAGGRGNLASGITSSIAGGHCNIASSFSSSIGGGYCNHSSGIYSFVGGGCRNVASAADSTVGGGTNNLATAQWSFIGGGYRNQVNTGWWSGVGSGCSNIVSACYSFIGGGKNNSVGGIQSGILGGGNNIVNHNNSFVIGSNITAGSDCTTYVNNLASCGLVSATGGCSTNWNCVYNTWGSTTNNSSNWDSAYSSTNAATASNTANTIVKRDGTGNFCAGEGCTVQWNSVYNTWGSTANNSSNWDCAYNNISTIPYICGTGSSIIPKAGSNIASRSYSNVAGGQYNTACGCFSNIAGGAHNKASGYYSNVAGGSHNTASGYSSNNVAGGYGNTASGYYYSNVAGGQYNTACGCFSNVAGGVNNNACGYASNVAGGSSNIASGYISNVAGGGYNTASGYQSNVAGGFCNIACGNSSTVSGGFCNNASGDRSFIAGGCGNITNFKTNTFILGSNITAISANYTYVNNLSSQGIVSATGGCSTNWNCVYNTWGSTTNNSSNWDSAYSSTNAATASNTANTIVKRDGTGNFCAGGGCTVQWNCLYSTWGSTCNNSSNWDCAYNNISTIPYKYGTGCCSIIPKAGSNIASGIYSAVAGGTGNNATEFRSFIGGGLSNNSNGRYSNVTGGFSNTAYGYASNVAGGAYNNASANYSNVAGGVSNTASGCGSSVIGGRQNNIATAGWWSGIGSGCNNNVAGCYSKISGGYNNSVSGNYSGILGGKNNIVSNNNSFVIGSSITTTAANTTYVNNFCASNNITGNIINSPIGQGIGNASCGTFTGIYATSSISTDSNLFVGGSLYLGGSAIQTIQNELIINEPVIYLAESNPADSLDIGFAGHNVVSGVYSHTGLLRTHGVGNPGTWYLFSSMTNEPSANSVATNSKTIDTLVANTSGSHTGNATTATTLQTSRNFSLDSGDVTSPTVSFNGSGDVSLTTTIANNAVTYAKFQQIPATSLVGNSSGSTGNVGSISYTTTGLALLQATNAAAAATAAGLGTGNSVTFTDVTVGSTSKSNQAVYTGTVTGSNITTIPTFSNSGSYKTVKYLVQIKNTVTNARAALEILATYNGATSTWDGTYYGIVDSSNIFTNVDVTTSSTVDLSFTFNGNTNYSVTIMAQTLTD